MADISTIAKQFTDYYYGVWDSDRSQLAPLYRGSSMLTFEGQPTLGGAAIIEKYVGLPFTTVQHKVTTMDAQPSVDGTSIIVLVTGQLITGDEANALSFSQAFHLVPEGASYYVHNDVFRLVYG